MANGITPALQSGNDEDLRRELSTLLIALRRLRADLASGRVTENRQILSIAEIDALVASLSGCFAPAPIRVRTPETAPRRFQRSDDPATIARRSANSWKALAGASS